MGGPGDKPLKVMTPFNEADVGKGLEEEPVHVMTPFNEADVGKGLEEEPVHVMTPFNEADVGKAPDLPVALPMQEAASYTIHTTPPDAVVAFSGDGQRTVEDYDDAIFFLGINGRGTFTFHGKQGFEIRGTGTVTAADVRTEFEAPNRDMRGVFTFPRDGQTGQVKLSSGVDRLVARATVGVSTD